MSEIPCWGGPRSHRPVLGGGSGSDVDDTELLFLARPEVACRWTTKSHFTEEEEEDNDCIVYRYQFRHPTAFGC